MMDLFGGALQSYDERHYNSGIGRNGKVYFHIRNKKSVTDEELSRIKSLRIPPSWRSVWISGDPRTDIQAIGVDTKGRKQYRYSSRHIEMAEREKFMRMFRFIRQLPKLNRAMAEHTSLDVYSKEHVIVTMLKLVRTLYLRVGKEQYAKQNKSYGISSLNKTHIRVQGDQIKLRFMGKSKQQLEYTYRNPEIARHLRRLLELKGPMLFQYLAETGHPRRITDTDLNQYIQTNMGDEFTIKDFRTYAANYHFIKALLEEIKAGGKNVKKNITNAFNVSSEQLSHTKSISKKAYVMPFIVKLYTEQPDFFVTRMYSQPKTVLLDVLKIYKDYLPLVIE